MVAHKSGDLGDGAAYEGYVAREHLPEYDAKGKDICRLLVGLSSEDLRCHPVWSPYLSIIVPHIALFIASESEITNLHRPVLSKEDVLGLEVAMQDFLLMQVHQGHGDLLSNVQHLIVIQGQLPLMKNLKEGPSVHELCYHI